MASAIAVGWRHACAIVGAGELRCWGHNNGGELGDGTWQERPFPVAVSGLSRGVAAVSAGHETTCALLGSGGVLCWGRNGEGELGDSTTNGRTVARGVVGLSGGVSAIDLGGRHACAITSGGGAKCWGSNPYGEVGAAAGPPVLIPTDIASLTSGVARIACGELHTCALLQAGAVHCWGYNGFGQLGDGSTNNSATPVVVTGLAAGVTALAAGYKHNCTLHAGGRVRCWGANWAGQLGDGTAQQREQPIEVPGLAAPAIAITAGDLFNCALLDDGRVQCWGDNHFGQLGAGIAWISATAQHVQGLGEPAVEIAAGGNSACAITASGRTLCWGDATFGRLGSGETGRHPLPQQVDLGSATARTVSCGYDHTCLTTTAGGARCVGGNGAGELGDGTFDFRGHLADVSGLTSGVAAVSAGDGFTCSLLAAGGAKCWGSNDSGRLGIGGGDRSPLALDVVSLTSGVRAVVAGGRHACAVTTGGGAKCWGENSYGQLGDGTNSARSAPTDVPGLASGVASMALGASGAHTCAVLDTGAVKCWGHNVAGQVGDGTTDNRNLPVDVGGLPGPVATVAAAEDHTCALTTTGAVLCWGANWFGQLGYGGHGDRAYPVAVVGLERGATAIAAGGNHSCAVRDDGQAFCWGINDEGQLGDGTLSSRAGPTMVVGVPERVVQIEAGERHTCAVTETGRLWCWGDNAFGKLGRGVDRSLQATPVLESGGT